MLKYFKIWIIFAKVSLIREIQYLSNFWMSVLVEVGYALGTIFIFEIFFYQVDHIGTWTKGDLYLVYGVFRIFSAIGSFVFRANLERFNSLVNSGEFDFVLLKPISPLFFSTLRIVSFSRVSQFLIGVAIFLWALSQVNLDWGPLQIAMIFIIIPLGVTTRYSVGVLINTPVFWFERMKNIRQLEYTLFSSARYPRIVFPKALQHLLIFVIPTLLVASLPIEVVLGKASIWWFLVYFIVSLAFLYIARTVFYFGVKQYNSASS